MQVYVDENINFKDKTCLALGSFDAVHIAHKHLMDTAIQYAKKHNAKAGVYQFLQRPAEILNPKDSKVLCSNEQKIKILEGFGLDFTYFEEFNEKFMHMSAEEFIKMLKSKFNVCCIVVGFHYKFGYRAEGDAEKLKELGKKYNFDVIVIAPIEHNGKLVSSTYIRNLISSGNVADAKNFLGRDYSIYLPVEHGRKVGTSLLNIPTANFSVSERFVIPKNGVYATYVNINAKKYLSVTNIGMRPTFNLEKKTIETHILDFEENLYDKKIELFFIKRLRDEIKFENSEQLKRQILSDIAKAKALFEKNNQNL